MAIREAPVVERRRPKAMRLDNANPVQAPRPRPVRPQAARLCDINPSTRAAGRCTARPPARGRLPPPAPACCSEGQQRDPLTCAPPLPLGIAPHPPKAPVPWAPRPGRRPSSHTGAPSAQRHRRRNARSAARRGVERWRAQTASCNSTPASPASTLCCSAIRSCRATSATRTPGATGAARACAGSCPQHHADSTPCQSCSLSVSAACRPSPTSIACNTTPRTTPPAPGSPFAHKGEKARRRDPRIFPYASKACPTSKRVREGGLTAPCCARTGACMRPHACAALRPHGSLHASQHAPAPHAPPPPTTRPALACGRALCQSAV